MLPDRGLIWASIRTDTTLTFAPTESLQLARARRYWLNLLVANRSQYT